MTLENLEEKLKGMNSADEVFDEFIERNTKRAERGEDVFSKRYANEVMLFTKYFLQNYFTPRYWDGSKYKKKEDVEIDKIEFRCKPYVKNERGMVEHYNKENYIISGNIVGDPNKKATVSRVIYDSFTFIGFSSPTSEAIILSIFADRCGIINLSQELYLSHLEYFCSCQNGNIKAKKLMKSLSENPQSRRALDDIPGPGRYAMSRGAGMMFYLPGSERGIRLIERRVNDMGLH